MTPLFSRLDALPPLSPEEQQLLDSVRALAREWGRKRVYLAPGGWGNGHGGACRNQTGIPWARVMVCLVAMQGLGKPGVNMGNLQWGTPIDFNFYFPGYADGGMSGDLENTSMPVATASAASGGSSGRMRRLQTGFVRSYALSMFVGAVLLVGALLLVRI